MRPASVWWSDCWSDVVKPAVAEASAAAPGLFESLKTLAAGMVGIAHTRLALLSTDVAEAREHLIARMVLVQLALLFAGLGMLLLALLIVGALWPHRLLALGVLGGLFVAMGAGVAWFATYRARTGPRFFEASLGELAKDRQHLDARDAS